MLHVMPGGRRQGPSYFSPRWYQTITNISLSSSTSNIATRPGAPDRQYKWHWTIKCLAISMQEPACSSSQGRHIRTCIPEVKKQDGSSWKQEAALRVVVAPSPPPGSSRGWYVRSTTLTHMHHDYSSPMHAVQITIERSVTVDDDASSSCERSYLSNLSRILLCMIISTRFINTQVTPPPE
jgi:hypothetical protein